MSNPQATKRKVCAGSFTLTMPIDRNLEHGQEQISPINQVEGLNWKVHVMRTNLQVTGDRFCLAASLHCDGDGSSELWRVKTVSQVTFNHKKNAQHAYSKVHHTFFSWNREFHNSRVLRDLGSCGFGDHEIFFGNESWPIEVIVVIESEIESFDRRPILDPKSAINDAILVLEGEKIPVNKQVLSAYSSYFNSLFHCDFKESKQDEIEIKDVDPENFRELLKMAYGVSSEPTTVENAIRFLTMADMFDLQIVKDRMVNFLLSTNLISIHRKLLIAVEHKLEILKNEIIPLYTNPDNLRDLARSPDFSQCSPQLFKDLFLSIFG